MGYIIAILAVLLLGGLFFLIDAEARQIYKELDNYQKRAENCHSKDALILVNKQLIDFAKKHCWHKAYAARAREVNAYIIGRVKGMK